MADHGTYARYQHGRCRCDGCRAAASSYRAAMWRVKLAVPCGHSACRGRAGGVCHAPIFAAGRRAYREANREKVAAQQRAYRAANREKLAAQRLAYLEANREKVAARQRAYRAANREKVAARQRAYRAANREKLAARQRAYYEANREKLAARQRAYYEANREKLMARDRAYKRSLAGELSRIRQHRKEIAERRERVLDQIRELEQEFLSLVEAKEMVPA